MSRVQSKSPLSETAPHILVVDDDRRLRELLTRYLGDHGFRVTSAKDAADARAIMQMFVFDGIVLDVMMPGENGFDFARSVRKTIDIPILMLTALSQTDDRVRGLETGVDDYLTKPFEPRELLLRINNMMRRVAVASALEKAPTLPENVNFGQMSFHLERRELRANGNVSRLTDRERELLFLLASRLGEVVPRDDISMGDQANERTVDVQINRLRRKIETDPANPLHLQTVRGIGYRLLID